MSSKVVSLKEAVAEFVRDGDVVALEGFTHLIPFAAGHEIIRQGKKDLTLCRLTPDLIYDQMIAAGCCRKLVFSWAGNPGVGSLHGFRRALEQGLPRPLELEEYSHHGMVMRFAAGAAGLSFLPVRSYHGSDLTNVNRQILPIRCPFTQESLWAVPALNPDVTIIHAQRADRHGNVQVWGLQGVQKEAAFAARRVIVTVEEIVDETVIRRDPNRTLLTAAVVSAVVHEPFGAHPSYVQGYYDRDNDFYTEWEEISREASSLERYLDEWVHGLEDRAAYVRKMVDRLERLKARHDPCDPVNYGY